MADFVISIRDKFLRRTTSNSTASATSPQTEDAPALNQSPRKGSFPRSIRKVSPRANAGEASATASPILDPHVADLPKHNHHHHPTDSHSNIAESTSLDPHPAIASSAPILPELTVQHPSPDNTKSLLPGKEHSPFSPPPLPPAPPQQSQPAHPQPPPTPQSRPDSPLSDPLPAVIHEVGSPEEQTASDVAKSPPKSSSSNKPTHKIRLPAQQDYFGNAIYPTSYTGMSRRKIWIKRPGQSATLVQITDDDLVDDVRDMVMRKYANSLGRTFDAPDVAVRIMPRERSHSSAERTLGPEEPVLSTLDSYFPGGQSVEEALIIDVPQRRTPRPSPRANAQHYYEDPRPLENGTDYFPPMPASPGAVHSSGSHEGRLQHSHYQHPAAHPHSISILETGQPPPLPSPRGSKPHHRPRTIRQHTSSPTVVTTSSQQGGHPTAHHTHRHSRSRIDSGASLQQHHANHNAPAPPPLPTPPATDQRDPLALASTGKVSTPPIDPRITSPRPGARTKKSRKQHSGDDHPPVGTIGTDPNITLVPNAVSAVGERPDRNNSVSSHPAARFLPSNLLDNSVPPINVLIVEDNIINLKLLEAFVKRLKVRWQTAMNGRDAVSKWREGGFHLVLMDIQLPIMSGLEATKEIRRLERVNGVGAFAKTEVEIDKEIGAGVESNGTSTLTRKESVDARATGEPQGDDKLAATDLFKSPVIIVALTASSLQSDRHEALAAGCNDFLTKPVNFLWLERKVMEWGCMQALIDYTGWRRWKDFAAEQEAKLQKEREGEDEEARKKREKKEKRKMELMEKMGKRGPAA